MSAPPPTGPPGGLPLFPPIPPGASASDTLGPQIIIASWLLTTAAAVFLLMRLSAKLWTSRALLVDDYILIVAWVAVLIPAITSTIAVGHGLGKHVFAVPPQEAGTLGILINSTITILIFAAALSKTSFALTVLRLVTGYLKVAAWFILVSTNFFLGLNIIFLWATFVFAPAGPTPASPSMLAILEALAAYGIAATVYSAAMDFALVGMAWSVLGQLKMRTTRERVGLGIAMSMGVLAGITSIVKAAILPSLAGGDISFAAASLHIWSIAEPSVTIMAASIPLLRVLFAEVKQMRSTRLKTFNTTTTTATDKGGTRSTRSFVSKSGTAFSIPSSRKSKVETGQMEFARSGPNDESDTGVLLSNPQEIASTRTTIREVRDLEMGDEALEEEEEEEEVLSPVPTPRLPSFDFAAGSHGAKDPWRISGLPR